MTQVHFQPRNSEKEKSWVLGPTYKLDMANQRDRPDQIGLVIGGSLSGLFHGKHGPWGMWDIDRAQLGGNIIFFMKSRHTKNVKGTYVGSTGWLRSCVRLIYCVTRDECKSFNLKKTSETKT